MAEFADIAPRRLESIEAGGHEPSQKQMERLAETYGVPLYSLFLENPPQLPPLPRDFRKADPSIATLTARGLRTLLLSEQISCFSAQLATALDYEPASFERGVRSANSPISKARRLRAAFDSWHEAREAKLQFSGREEYRFLSALRLFFEVQGGIVNINDSPPGDYFGFYIQPKDGIPVIFVNRKISSRKAQLFTLVHEYAHALSGFGGISDPFSAQNLVERECNVFAAEFLAPADQFEQVVSQISAEERSDVDQFIRIASSRTLLSMHATAIRLVEGSYLSQQKFRAWRRLFVRNPRLEKDEEKEAETTTTGGAPHAKRLSEIGYLPIELARQAVRKKLIDSYDVTSGLGLSAAIQERAFDLAARRFEIALP